MSPATNARTKAAAMKRVVIEMKLYGSLAIGLLLIPSFFASAAPAKPVAVRPADRSGTIVIPDRFLRRWDPVTVFFDSASGPAAGGPEDHAEKFATLAPEQPGAWTWLDAKTLQFRPAEPWPPLARFTVGAAGKTFNLTTLMAAPTSSQPSADAENLDPVEEIRLTFAEPMDTDALARMTTIELRALPGVGGGNSRWLNRDDFSVKPLQRKDRSDSATYVLALAHPIPFGTRAIVHLRLSLDDDSSESLVQIAFSTDEPFRIERVGCRGAKLPITPEGTRYTKDAACAAIPAASRCSSISRRCRGSSEPWKAATSSRSRPPSKGSTSPCTDARSRSTGASSPRLSIA
jgi:hypothetical protein